MAGSRTLIWRLANRSISRVEETVDVDLGTARMVAATIDEVAAATVAGLRDLVAPRRTPRRRLPRVRPVLDVDELGDRDEWRDGRHALERFLTDLGADRDQAPSRDRDTARWDVAGTTAEVALVYGTPVISITQRGGTAAIPITAASVDRLWATHDRAGRIGQLV